jgi:hypothetical protein
MQDTIPNGIPSFDGSNFEYWSNRMETYLKVVGADVWFSVASGYNALKKAKTTAQKEAKRNNKLAIDTILDGLIDSVKSKVGSCASSKELWDKLQDLYVREDAEEEEEEELEANYNVSDFKEENRGQFFLFNCEGVGHVEFECPHPRIERNETEEENSNEEEEKIIQQEDENLKKLKHVEIENSKLKDTQRKLRSELGSCEKTVVILKKQLEDFEKLREETISLKTLL